MINKSLKHKIITASFTLVLASAITFVQPVYNYHVFGAVMEDCDLDGYDDHTGKAVPWRGFDGTKGDEVPDDWDGVSDSYHKSTQKNDSKNDSKSDSNSVKKEETTTVANVTASTQNEAKSAENSVVTNEKSDSVNTGTTKSISKKSNSNKSKKVSDSSNNRKADKKKKKSTDSKQNETESATVQETIQETTQSDETESIEDGQNSDKTVQSESENIDTEVENSNPDEVENAGNPEEIEDNGNPEENVEENNEGKSVDEIVEETTDEVADTFFKAATVGFSKDNKQLVPGVEILAGLFFLGLTTLLGDKIRRK